MTVLEASMNLYQWFLEHDTFSDTGKDFISLMEISDTPDEDKAAYYCALRQLEEQQMISFYKDASNQKMWILQRDLQQCDQELKINYLTAMQMAHVINSFCDVMKNEQNKCNPAQITEEDLRSLVFINQTLAGDENKENNDGDVLGGLLPPAF